MKVRYRLVQIQPESQVKDMVSQWENQPVVVPAGRIQGVVYDFVSQAPASNVMVSIAGISTITSSDGSYTLDGVPVGTYNLVAYSLDGSYKTFQQEAMIAADLTTPATLQLEPTRLVKSNFYRNSSTTFNCEYSPHSSPRKSIAAW